MTAIAPSSTVVSSRLTYSAVRALSESICQPLAIEDYGLQAMPDVSPAKWHLAHTTWFFETFLLQPYQSGYTVFHPGFGYLFNSYYEALGNRHPRPQRGLISRPTVAEVYRYRQVVDEAMGQLLRDSAGHEDRLALIQLGLHHEQQHQELLLMDLKYNFWVNPLRPVYRPIAPAFNSPPAELRWCDYIGGISSIGHVGSDFAFDNETPQHRVLVEDFRLANRLVTNGEYLEFMQAGGYLRSELWLSQGWSLVQSEGWQAPLYWQQVEGQWQQFGLAGMQALDLNQPVCHVSYFEADAYARWRDCRLPTEAEWEISSQGIPVRGNFLEGDRLHPMAAQGLAAPDQIYGDVWEWTSSPYQAYPGYKPLPGAVGEYNGKFMCNQMVLRGGCCLTPINHIRSSYRNFFPPHSRWMVSGIRLGADA
jgi:ergothioneine biosynthesis protein EgtB